MTRAEAADELDRAGWPSVAMDMRDGVPLDVIARRLRDLSEGDSDAAHIVALTEEDA